MSRSFLVLLAAFAAVVTFAVAAAAQGGDQQAVHRAALDYVEGIYEVKPDLIRRGVHPTLAKRGFYKKDAGGPYVETTMTFEQLVDLAGRWNKEGKRDTSIKQVKVLDVLDQTAIAQITASWGVDHMLLAKIDGKWQIVQILWQSPPPTAKDR